MFKALRLIKETSSKTVLWIAWRNLTSRRKGHGLSFMTTVSLGGVSLGVMTLIVVLSVMGGFEGDLRRQMIGGAPHIEVHATNPILGFSSLQHPLSSYRKKIPEAIASEPFIKADVVIKHGLKMQHAILHGVDEKKEDHLWVFGNSMIVGSFADLDPVSSQKKTEYPGMILGEGLASSLDVGIGDELLVINPQTAVSAGASLGGTTIRRFSVVGIFMSNQFDYDSKWAVTSLSQARRFMLDYGPELDEEKYVSGYAFNVKQPEYVSDIGKRFTNDETVTVTTWEQSNESLLLALKLEKFAMGSILMLIVVVAAFSISGTMMMTVYYRQTAISLLRALGMTRRRVAKLYLLQGFGIGVVGSVLGLVGGLLLCWLISSFHAVPLPSIYTLRELPVKYIWSAYPVILVFSIFFSLLAAGYPSWVAATQEPSEGLRFE